MHLGLTSNQARAYLTLVNSGPSIARDIADSSKITRQDIYRVLPGLEKAGLIETQIGRPTVYNAIPIQQAISILLKRMSESQLELCKKAKELAYEVEQNNNHLGKENKVNYGQIVMIHGKDTINQKINETLNKLNISFEVVTSASRFSSMIIEFNKGYQKALQRGATIHITTEKSTTHRNVREILGNLSKNTGFEIRYFNDAPEAMVSVADGKEAFLTMASVAHIRRSALWSNESSFVTLAHNFFRNQWNNSSKQKTHRVATRKVEALYQKNKRIRTKLGDNIISTTLLTEQ
jgi:sugar-specific transcriptional regulator TrmB